MTVIVAGIQIEKAAAAEPGSLRAQRLDLGENRCKSGFDFIARGSPCRTAQFSQAANSCSEDR